MRGFETGEREDERFLRCTYNLNNTPEDRLSTLVRVCLIDGIRCSATNKLRSTGLFISALGTMGMMSVVGGNAERKI